MIGAGGRRARAIVQGIVQGVGFRPFIYNLANRHGLNGYVSNAGAGVEIEVEGEPGEIERFFRQIRARKPPLAEITHVETQYLPPLSHQGFVIRESRAEAGRAVLISPDIGVCPDCLREMADPGDRRHLYPFTNCTNCGPRYTIIKDIPYDRDKTSMASFILCGACQTEYDDPSDRRFHAQPNACPACGPQVRLHDHTGRPLAGDDPIRQTRALLAAGKIVAVKGLGGFHLAVDATSDEAVERLRDRKHREEKPLALMSPSLEQVEQYARVDSLEARELCSARRPIVLLGKRDRSAVSGRVAPRNRYIGAMLPYTPLHHLILGGEFPALVMTSGNRSDEPIAIENDEAFRRLAGIADAFLVHDRDIHLRNDDSVVRVVDGRARLVRRSRGYVPAPVALSWPLVPILACGPFLKNTICLARGENAFLSQHVGDLENLESFDFFEMTVEHFRTILEIEPEVIAHDLHPDYLSTRYALGLEGLRRVGVQHHHAHIASCMAENGVTGTLIGLAMDGTGYGADGAAWGGEVLAADLGRFERAGHFQYTPLPGGDAAVKEPWRMALAYLYLAFGRDLLDLPIEFVRRLDRDRARRILTMIDRGVNCPATSSCGRLFDGIAALIGLRDRVSYEGQAAVELEMEMGDGDGLYPVRIDGGEPLIIRHDPIIRGVVSDLSAGLDRGTISRKFHNTLVRAFTEVCTKIRDTRGLDRVALSGGVFQNIFLLGALEKALLALGFEVYTHSRVPANDGGISLGQAVVANAVLER